jgi:hypothetical protein
MQFVDQSSFIYIARSIVFSIYTQKETKSIEHMDGNRGSRALSSCLRFLYLTSIAKDTTKRVEQVSQNVLLLDKARGALPLNLLFFNLHWLQGQANKGTNGTDGKRGSRRAL